MPKKGSSAIVVEAERYRWSVNPDSGYMTLVIEDASGKGRRLEVQKDYDAPITPGVVRDCILEARKLGWNPTSRGKPVRLTRNAGQYQLLDPMAAPDRASTQQNVPNHKQKRPQVGASGGYPCPVCNEPSLQYAADGYFSCVSC